MEKYRNKQSIPRALLPHLCKSIILYCLSVQ